MTIIFDGTVFAAQKEKVLKKKIIDLKTSGITPHLASILVGDDPASRLYIGLKKKAADRIGAELDIYFLPKSSAYSEILQLITSLNQDSSINGIMVQLPLPGSLAEYKNIIVESIDPKKDVDGLRSGSQFLHPTSKAVIDILNEAEKELKVKLNSVSVVGATGMVGMPLVKELKKEGYNVFEASAKTEDLVIKLKMASVIVSATGVPDLIKPDMVKDGVVVIDVGSPKGDVEHSVASKASFFTPVPGGVGPVTISCLLENLLISC